MIIYIFPLDLFWPRKHPESDRDPKPRVAVNAHAPGMQDSPNSGISAAALTRAAAFPDAARRRRAG